MTTVVVTVIAVGLLAVLFVIARAAARDQRARRDQPLDKAERRASVHEHRREHADMVRTMLFGRFAGDGRRSRPGPDDD